MNNTYLNLQSKTCFSCLQIISEKSLLVLSRKQNKESDQFMGKMIETSEPFFETKMYYHEECLLCNRCGCSLNDMNVGYCRNNFFDIVCPKCKFRLTYCNRCNLKISSASWVYHAFGFLYHLSCFKCKKCERKLKTGDKIVMICEDIFCEDGCNSKLEHEASNQVICQPLKSLDNFTNFTSQANMSNQIVNNFESSNQYKNCRDDMFKSTNNLRQQHQDVENTYALEDIDIFNYSESSEFDTEYNTESTRKCKSKRPRTIFTAFQIKILQSSFKIDTIPSIEELDLISKLAGLGRRVTQVWFQNARAKSKKINCKSDINSHHKNAIFNKIQNKKNNMFVKSSLKSINSPLPTNKENCIGNKKSNLNSFTILGSLADS